MIKLLLHWSGCEGEEKNPVPAGKVGEWKFLNFEMDLNSMLHIHLQNY
jgi:hypothetical protein